MENHIVLNGGLDVTVQNEDIDDIMVSALEGGTLAILMRWQQIALFSMRYLVM